MAIIGSASLLALLLASQSMAAHAPVAPSIAGLPLVELPPDGDSHQIAVFYSGNGGWAALDRSVSAHLAGAGVTVYGVNTLRYFRRERRPEEAAYDLARVLETYLRDKPSAEDILLIGYSTGADVLPFIVNRLPEDLRARISSVTLIAPSHHVEFRVRFADWIPRRRQAGVPVMPEVEQLAPPALCLYGQDDRGVLCPELTERTRSAVIGKGHHLGRDYQAIAERILSFTASNATEGAARER